MQSGLFGVGKERHSTGAGRSRAGWYNKNAASYCHIKEHLPNSSHLVWFHFIEQSALWLVEAMANWVVRCEMILFIMAVTNQKALGSNEMGRMRRVMW